MRFILSGLGLLLAIGVALLAAIVAFWFAAAYFGNLIALTAVMLLVAALIGGVLARLLAKRAFGRRGAAISGGLVPVALLLAFFANLIVNEPPQLEAPQVDVRGPHLNFTLGTGSVVAAWRVPAVVEGDAKAHLTPVIYLHGGAGLHVRPRDLEIAKGFAAAGFEVVAFDQAGSGASADLPIEAYRVPRAVADIEALRVALGSEKLVLWGQSWGATLGAAYAAAYPDRVAGFVAESPGELPGQALVDEDWSVTNHQAGMAPPLKLQALYLLLVQAPQLAEQWLPQARHHAYNNAYLHANTAGGAGCKGDAPSVKQPLVSNTSLYTLVRLRQSLEQMPARSAGTEPLKIPTLVLRGKCDFVPKVVADIYASAFKPSQAVEIDGAGHMMVGQEAMYAAQLKAFAERELSAAP